VSITQADKWTSTTTLWWPPSSSAQDRKENGFRFLTNDLYLTIPVFSLHLLEVMSLLLFRTETVSCTSISREFKTLKTFIANGILEMRYCRSDFEIKETVPTYHLKILYVSFHI